MDNAASWEVLVHFKCPSGQITVGRPEIGITGYWTGHEAMYFKKFKSLS
jgi:hypothetical protein